MMSDMVGATSFNGPAPAIAQPAEGETSGNLTLGAPARSLEISCHDDVLSVDSHKQIRDFLGQPGWHFGWRSNPQSDQFAFWHKHFAGNTRLDDADADVDVLEQSISGFDPAVDLRARAPLLGAFWDRLASSMLQGHRLVRCYANAFSFGCEGTLHADAKTSDSFTCIYYPNTTWHPNWGGETAFFKQDGSDLVTSIYPKPNRIVLFSGAIPHVARGVTRTCPTLRVTLMFKTRAIR